jgi:hypothetical protein
MRNVLLAAAMLALVVLGYCAVRSIERDKTTALTDPNLPTIKYIGHENPDSRFRFNDRPPDGTEAP